jgi:ubiquitin carboxyl-terminal hydrolase 5/13
MLHYRKTGHCLVLNISATGPTEENEMKKEQDQKQEGDDESGTAPSAKFTKVEVRPDMLMEQAPIITNYKIICLACSSTWANVHDKASLGEAAVAAVDGIISSSSASKKAEVASWQEEVVPCEHTLSLVQSFDPIASRAQSKECCSECSLRENLWMCLSCGAIGCGRKQYDGTGGNGHGLAHFELFQHPVAIKLGTITPEGDGDVFCYCCNEMRLDPQLSEHLAAFGIDVSSSSRTERTMAELQLERNLKFDFSMVSGDGHALRSVRGNPWRVGMKNTGNSCYFNAVIQSLFHLDSFKEFFGQSRQDHLKSCHRDPAACFTCQASKLLSSLATGKPSIINPWMMKAVCTSGHGEFSSARQQDASEFLCWFLKVIQRNDPSKGQGLGQLLDAFQFAQEQRIKCAHCGHLQAQRINALQLSLQLYSVLSSPLDNNATLKDRLSLDQFLANHFAEEALEGNRCSACGTVGQRRKSLVLLSPPPRYFLLTLSRYVMRNWVPSKFDMAVAIPFERLDLSPWISQPSSVSAQPELPVVDDLLLTELISMGFPEKKCIQALQKTENSNVEAAATWILEHLDDPVDESMSSSAKNAKASSSSPALAPESIQMLMDAGFTRDQASKALSETDGDIERAFDWILNHPDDIDFGGAKSAEGQKIPSPDVPVSTVFKLRAFICHRGPSVHCGHYICHIRVPGLSSDLPEQWVMFNDERVVLDDPAPPLEAAEHAYILVYERC